MTHLEVSAGETALHEASDCLCVAGSLGQVHLHSEAAAKPAGKKKVNINMHNMAIWWVRREGYIVLTSKNQALTCIKDHRGGWSGGVVMSGLEDKQRSLTCS